MAPQVSAVRDASFVLRHVLDVGRLAALPAFQGAGLDELDELLGEAGRFAGGYGRRLRQVLFCRIVGAGLQTCETDVERANEVGILRRGGFGQTLAAASGSEQSKHRGRTADRCTRTIANVSGINELKAGSWREWTYCSGHLYVFWQRESSSVNSVFLLCP